MNTAATRSCQRLTCARAPAMVALITLLLATMGAQACAYKFVDRDHHTQEFAPARTKKALYLLYISNVLGGMSQQTSSQVSRILHARLRQNSFEPLGTQIKEPAHYYILVVESEPSAFAGAQGAVNTLAILNIMVVIPMWTTQTWILNVDEIQNGKKVNSYTYQNSIDTVWNLVMQYIGFLLPGTDSMMDSDVEDALVLGLVNEFIDEVSK
ncbi:MAG: hypothetical protein KDK39_17020 [Leptospiraceae bacterium]|nr:hypothetical protein [Leptospiraceae bacterium]